MMTPAQEKEVRAIDRRCRGPALLSDADQRRELDLVYAAADADEVGRVLAIAEKWAKALGQAGVRPGFEPVAEALRIIGAHTEACGYDVNSLVAAEDADGGEHEAACPNCGTVISWRAPRFD